jgi:hypothetical protein
MSAFICNDSHITAVAAYAARNRILGYTDANQIGEMLHAENVRSVNYRYDETTQPSFELCQWAAFHEFSLVQIVKAARCLGYQSCEHPGWQESDACKLLQATTAGHPCHDMPGYDEAEWEIRPPAANAEAEAAGMTPSPSYLDIHKILAERRQIAHIWSIEDVQGIRPDLSEDQCWEVLQHVDRYKDAELGITWLTLEMAAEHLFGDAPDTDESEEA